jgi:hypothetical protein
MSRTTTKPKTKSQLEVTLSNKSENPFYGMKNTLILFQNAGKGSINANMLDSAFKECNTKEKREMFFSILFSIGDITARQHNIFGKDKIDTGGNAQREAFKIVMSWMRTNHYHQFKNFMFAHLFNEYTSFDNLLLNRVKTQKKKAKIVSIESALSGDAEYIDDLAMFIANIIKGSNPVNKYFVSKFLTRPRLSVRKGHKRMLPETKQIMKDREAFIKLVSDKASLPYTQKKGYIDFHGYYNWRKEYNQSLESVLFSSGKISEFDEQEFLSWLDKLPSGARFRVRCRLLTDKNTPKSDKWKNLPSWFLKWEDFKERKQSEQRVIEEKVRQGTASEKEVNSLKQIKKEAKVTTGAVAFDKMFSEIILGTVDKLKVQPFLDKVKLDYNTLVFIDDSGSMASGYNASSYGFTAYDFACFIATICLMKNPDDDARSLLGFYSSTARLYSVMEGKAKRKNNILNPISTETRESLVDPNLHFLDNLKRIRGFAEYVRTSNGTNISCIINYIEKEVENNPDVREQLMNYPVWTIITDGNWNNMSSPEASMNDFMRRCENVLGFKPFIIAIDVSKVSASAERFSGIENFMFLPPNPAQVEQFLTNFKDIDVMDVYTPLQSVYRSSRYSLVRKYTI